MPPDTLCHPHPLYRCQLSQRRPRCTHWTTYRIFVCVHVVFHRMSRRYKKKYSHRGDCKNQGKSPLRSGQYGESRKQWGIRLVFAKNIGRGFENDFTFHFKISLKLVLIQRSFRKQKGISFFRNQHQTFHFVQFFLSTFSSFPDIQESSVLPQTAWYLSPSALPFGNYINAAIFPPILSHRINCFIFHNPPVYDGQR